MVSQWKWWARRMAAAAQWEGPAAPALKIFKSKFGLPVLRDYRVAAPEEFWVKFPVNTELEGKSLINPKRLAGLSIALGTSDPDALAVVCRNLEGGAEIGCVGAFREPSVSTNAPSAFEYPVEVTDAVASWVEKKFVYGPVKREQVPAGVKISGIMCRPKPNGSARVILNLSAPLGKSVNEGIDAKRFPAVMGSTKRWVRIMRRAGRGCWMMKADWQEAYKHLRVAAGDVKLQWFEWLGRFFVELCLVFGAASSAGLYDQAAKVVLDLALRLGRFPAWLVCQYLDDVCAAAAASRREELERFARAYRAVAEHVGVRLAPLGDPDKAFDPCTRGVVLGVEYDSVAWTWRIPDEKLFRLLEQIRQVAAAERVRQEELASLVGRILHYSPLIQGGRFHLDHLLKAKGEVNGRREWVAVRMELRRQLGFWELLLKAVSGMGSIMDGGRPMPAWTREVFTDAAGGTLDSVGRGCGGVSEEWWFYVPWTRKINAGVRAADGKKLSRKLSALELVGPLVAMAAAPDRWRGQAVRFWVDNAGSVRIWAKGYSLRCGLCTSLVKALAAVAAALGCRVHVEKITRCSSAGAEMADALSKGSIRGCMAIGEFNGWQLQPAPAAVPRAVLRWLANPVVDDLLGDKILRELAQVHAVLGYSALGE